MREESFPPLCLCNLQSELKSERRDTPAARCAPDDLTGGHCVRLPALPLCLLSRPLLLLFLLPPPSSIVITSAGLDGGTRARRAC